MLILKIHNKATVDWSFRDMVAATDPVITR